MLPEGDWSRHGQGPYGDHVRVKAIVAIGILS